MRDRKRAIRANDIGFLDLPAVLVDEIVREGRADWRLGKLRTRLTATGDAAGNGFEAGTVILDSGAAGERQRADQAKCDQFHVGCLSFRSTAPFYLKSPKAHDTNGTGVFNPSRRALRPTAYCLAKVTRPVMLPL